MQYTIVSDTKNFILKGSKNLLNKLLEVKKVYFCIPITGRPHCFIVAVKVILYRGCSIE